MRAPIVIQPDKLARVLQENEREGYHFHVGRPGHASSWFIQWHAALEEYKREFTKDKTVALYRCKGECIVYKTPRVPQAVRPLQVIEAQVCPRCEMPCTLKDQLTSVALTTLYPCRVCSYPHDNAQWQTDRDYYIKHGAKDHDQT
jgi:hypothetical protein